MKIAIFGATGTIGRRIAQGALARGHELTAIVRDPARLDISHERLTAVKGDDAVISTYGLGSSGQGREPDLH